MKIRVGFAILVISCIACSGCTTLSDSSLIYGSRQSVGIGLESGADGNPFPGFNLGYLGLDFAKVPVAVQLDKDDPELSLVWGSYCGGDTQERSVCASLFSEKQVAVVDLDSLAESSGISLADARRSVQNAAGELRLNQFASSSTRASFSLTENVGIDDLKRKITRSMRVQNPSFTTGAGNDGNIADSVSASVSETSADDVLRKDAFSVYGSFNTEADASAATLGKVFATGVAAQTIAESAAQLAKAKCLEAAKANNLSPEQIIEMCD